MLRRPRDSYCIASRKPVSRAMRVPFIIVLCSLFTPAIAEDPALGGACDPRTLEGCTEKESKFVTETRKASENMSLQQIAQIALEANVETMSEEDQQWFRVKMAILHEMIAHDINAAVDKDEI